jgi:hypothetical protein
MVQKGNPLVYAPVYNKDRQRVEYVYLVGASTVITTKEDDVALFIARASACDTKPHAILEALYQDTTLCLYDVCGCCPHPECTWSHNRNLHDIIGKLIRAKKEVKVKEKEWQPQVYKVAKEWRQRWQDLGFHLLSKRFDNIQKVYWHAHNAKSGEYLKLAKKVVRQYILGHVAYDDKTLHFALDQLIDVSVTYNSAQSTKATAFAKGVSDYQDLLGEV